TQLPERRAAPIKQPPIGPQLLRRSRRDCCDTEVSVEDRELKHQAWPSATEGIHGRWRQTDPANRRRRNQRTRFPIRRKEYWIEPFAKQTRHLQNFRRSGVGKVRCIPR